ncbi:class I SAM-dependent methyltransferase [Mobilicoccus caccae]|uniref:Methyltransferase n=1 Tax=Mobilicoccus caccae TaxID=1859295 RepID=A0ABQ6IU68_9MICO|nr:class I SAM-dependent methyltransferase [Mobilicoccus caccae]GMA40259.1 methyltransferase [Mobilicoccus caccae]
MSEPTTSIPLRPTGRRGPPEQQMQGHWLLATLGKRVLRPGGLALTRRLLQAAAPGAGDRIVEFGPGVGRTATVLLAAEPTTYVAVDPNPEGSAALTAVLARHPQARLEVRDAADTGLPTGQADLVVGEAMLSMHDQKTKDSIVAEAARLLGPGGRYAIHELERIEDAGTRSGAPVGGPGDPVSREISRTIKVGARPLTLQGWQTLLEAHGLEIVWTAHAPMRLLEPTRVFADEGVIGATRFFVNVARNKPARERVLAMRKSFRDNRAQLGAIAIVARRRA